MHNSLAVPDEPYHPLQPQLGSIPSQHRTASTLQNLIQPLLLLHNLQLPRHEIQSLATFHGVPQARNREGHSMVRDPILFLPTLISVGIQLEGKGGGKRT